MAQSENNSGVFPPVPADFSFPKTEEEVLKLWTNIDAFKRSVENREKSAESAYVFYDGPPFATGLPHYGHLVASTLKDIVPRYWAMKGKRVERRFGWDTHGLPIEMEMEKELDLSGPESIREYGVDKFNEACRANVLRYTSEWRETIGRLGRWVDFDNDYKTMDLSFMESVWWVFSQLWDKGLVYQGVRVMPYSWRLSTPLSNFEANLDYRDVDDPAVTVTMPIDGDKDGAALLAWTTTPWTLPSNLGLAVNPAVPYVRVKAKAKEKGKDGGEGVYIVAKDLMEKVLGDDVEVLAEMKGEDLVGLSYTPLFSYFADLKKAKEDGGQGAFVVMASDHVTTEDGTGVVHMAPAYGEDDFAACQKVGIEPVDPVDEQGRFEAVISDFVGQNVKEADKNIIARLKDDGRMFNHATIRHSYPFCWRSGTPLIYKTFPVWFVRVEGMRDAMQKNNEAVHWVPSAVGEKRFGNWLADARDWAISRNRFWGTPIPLWRCDDCGHTQCISSAEELAKKSGSAVDDIHPHKIDDRTIACDKCGNDSAKRVPEVFDCWFESGSMPYAQVHYPFEKKEEFEHGFPAEFIAEGLDQTRGWFYTLLILGTALRNSAPYKNVIVNGMVLATAYTDHEGNRYERDAVDVKGGKAFRKSDGKELKVTREKMSKRLRNYPDPTGVLDKYGADALRAYLIDSPVVRAEPLAFSEDGVREVVRSVLLPLKNAWSFFVMYANVDGWNPKTDLEKAPPLAERPELDRWIVSVLQSLVDEVNEQMEGYYLYRVVGPILGFIDHLTNWYIRRSRRRFWRNADDEAGAQDKAAAYATLYEVLVTFAQVMAPVLPFVTESIFQDLVVTPGCATGDGDNKCDSVHLCDYPVADEALRDSALEQAMETTRAIVTLGRAVREKHKLKTRQPLATCTVVSHNATAREDALAHAELIAEELNVKKVVVVEDDADLSVMSFKANFKTLGKRLGKRMKEGAAAIAALGRDDFAKLTAGETLNIADIDISVDDVIVSREARGDVVLESEGELTVALDTTLDAALVAEGLMREVVSRVQKLRKDGGFEITDRVRLVFSTADAELKAAIEGHVAAIAEEVLATDVSFADALEGEALDLEGRSLTVKVDRS